MAVQFSQTIRALNTDSARGAHVAWIIVSICLAGWALWFGLSSVGVFETSQRARLEVRKASHTLDALIAGQITTTSLTIGREVKAGDVLVELDSSRERLRAREENARLEGLLKRTESLRREIAARESSKSEDLETAAAAVEVASARLRETQVALDLSTGTEQRVAQLVASGAGSRVEAIRAAAESQKLRATRSGWEAEALRMQREARSKAHQNEAQIEALRHALASLESDAAMARVTIERLSVENEKYLIRAPISGRLADVAAFRVGSYVAEGQRLATVLPADDLMIVAEFAPSVALGRIRPLQRARLRLDGFPWAQYGTVGATVESIAGEVRDGLVRVELRVDHVPNSGIVLQHGLPGALEVVVEEATPATLVLRSAGVLLAGAARKASLQ
ncbi:MAG: HlyD family efflux transporter periplasmic adaptor subunit [Beijerinckiaceae bacterium]|nr:HlyD family efflux transporter periplasmic adaptor subunit [Beijerinckiaceae bacterium]